MTAVIDDGAGVTVMTSDGRAYRGRTAIVTVSLGVLKDQVLLDVTEGQGGGRLRIEAPFVLHWSSALCLFCNITRVPQTERLVNPCSQA